MPVLLLEETTVHCLPPGEGLSGYSGVRRPNTASRRRRGGGDGGNLSMMYLDWVLPNSSKHHELYRENYLFIKTTLGPKPFGFQDSVEKKSLISFVCMLDHIIGRFKIKF